MKNLAFVFAFCFSTVLQAQSPDVTRANRFFEKTFYSVAIPIYEKVLQEEASFVVLNNLADSYYYTNQYAKANELYAMMKNRFKDNLSKDYYFRYAQTLKIAGKNEEAFVVMRDYFVESNQPLALLELEKENNVLENVRALGNRFDVKSLEINTANSEFGAVPFGQNLIFSGVSNTANWLDGNYKWNNQKYLDLISVPLDQLGVRDVSLESFSNEINTALHEGNAVFTKDGKTVYFSRNNYVNGKRARNKDKISNVQLFKGEFNGTKWTKIVALPFNNENYSYEHPALSNDEKRLYFASDMPGSLGSFDLYYVTITDGSYGSPINLGNVINTDKKEQFPFIAKDGKLYFSSEGHASFGMLDVFCADYKDENFVSPENVGLPVNSPYDDFSFYINSDSKQGYFASNRAGGKGSDDIYQLKETKPLVIEDCKQMVEGVVLDKDTNTPLAEANVQLMDQSNVIVETTSSKKDGSYSFELACSASYTVLATKVGFTEQKIILSTDTTRNKNNQLSLPLRSLVFIEQAALAAVEAEKEKQVAKELAAKKAAEALLLKNKADKIAADLKEKERAKEQIKIQEAKIKAAKVAAEAEAKVQVEKRVAAMVSTEKAVVLSQNELIITTDPIYFDVARWYIRKDTKPILDKVIAIMNRNPTMVVEIASYTDNRGNARLNLDLSAKRANSSRDYFIQNGIQPDRIIAKGYGATKQIIKCEPSESCTEEQHELNRRNVFVIKSM